MIWASLSQNASREFDPDHKFCGSVETYLINSLEWRLDCAGLVGSHLVIPVVTLSCFPGFLDNTVHSLTLIISLSGISNGSMLLFPIRKPTPQTLHFNFVWAVCRPRAAHRSVPVHEINSEIGLNSPVRLERFDDFSSGTSLTPVQIDRRVSYRYGSC